MKGVSDGCPIASQICAMLTDTTPFDAIVANVPTQHGQHVSFAQFGVLSR